MLDDALSELREHRRTPTKAILLFLDDDDGKYDVAFSQAGLSMSQALSLVEIGKSVLIKNMGY